jgi:hypothetical protein
MNDDLLRPIFVEFCRLLRQRKEIGVRIKKLEGILMQEKTRSDQVQWLMGEMMKDEDPPISLHAQIQDRILGPGVDRVEERKTPDRKTLRGAEGGLRRLSPGSAG